MSDQRHRIRRQVLEIVIPDQDAAWPLQAELGRIQRESLEAIVDRCCTEAGDPGRLHRIESLEVDLGHIDPDNLEHDLVEKLGPRLREALAARIHAEDEATSLSGADSETIARLELLAFFAKTGTLPWWADASRPRLLDETAGLLLQRAPRPLCALVRTLARDLRWLRRLVLHCEEERLTALFTALAASAPLGLAERPDELRALLARRSAIAGVLPGPFRRAVWVAALRAVGIEENAGVDAVSFWRGTLSHAALELGVSYTFLVTRLHETRETGRGERPDAAFAIVQSLYREVRGEAVASDSALHESESRRAAASARLPAEALGEAQRLLREALERVRGAEPTIFGDGDGDGDGRVRWPAPDARRSESAREEQSGDASAYDSNAPATDSDAPEADSDAPEADSDILVTDSDALVTDSDAPEADSGAGEVEAILDRLESMGIQPSALLRELRAMARLSPARGRIPWLDALRDLDQRAIAHGPGAPATASSLVQLLRRVIVSRWLPRREILRGLEEVESRAPAGLPADVLGEAQRPPQEVIEEQSRDASSLDSNAPPTDSNAPPTDSNAPPTDSNAPATDSNAPAPDSNAPAADSNAPAADSNAPAADSNAPAADSNAPAADEVEGLLDRLDRSGLPLGALFTELRAVVRRAGAHRPGAARRPARLPDMPDHLPRSVLDALKDLERQTRTHGPNAPETASSVIRLLHSAIASRSIGARALESALGELERAAVASPEAQAGAEAQRLLRKATPADHAKSTFESPPLNLAYGDSEDVYVENAGLVILWPFLGHLFERLDLLSDKRFKDRSAQHRAVGLLQYLVTEDPSPPEYQVLLARVLCGMDMTEVFDFGPPVTEAEAEECSNLLAAAIASAPVLKEMSIAGFRGSFLLRKGVLGPRDGSWLLCVERVAYDVVLDRFPWGTSWVKLPWMDAPLSVEW